MRFEALLYITSHDDPPSTFHFRCLHIMLTTSAVHAVPLTTTLYYVYPPCHCSLLSSVALPFMVLLTTCYFSLLVIEPLCQSRTRLCFCSHALRVLDIFLLTPAHSAWVVNWTY